MSGKTPTGRVSPVNCPLSRRLTTENLASQENPPSRKIVPRKSGLLVFFDTNYPTVLTLVASKASTPVTSCNIYSFLPLINLTRNSILDVAGVEDLLLNCLGQLFLSCLSVRQRGQLVTHD